jgi:hypothetical protein
MSLASFDGESSSLASVIDTKEEETSIVATMAFR